LFSICGNSSVIFQAPRVVGIRDQTLAAAVCITGSSTVEFNRGVFSKMLTSQGALLAVGSTRVTLRASEVTHNTANSTFVTVNTGGGIVAQERAQVYIVGSMFANNRVLARLAAMGAAVVAQDRANVVISNTTFEHNAALAPRRKPRPPSSSSAATSTSRGGTALNIDAPEQLAQNLSNVKLSSIKPEPYTMDSKVSKENYLSYQCSGSEGSV
jgi:hypothetical protein